MKYESLTYVNIKRNDDDVLLLLLLLFVAFSD